MNKVEVTFTHPRGPGEFPAAISLQCTGKKAIDGLVLGNANGPFLDPPQPGRPYELALKRTQTVITPNMTFEQAGVMNGDVIEVRWGGQGA